MEIQEEVFRRVQRFMLVATAMTAAGLLALGYLAATLKTHSRLPTAYAHR